MIKTNSLWFKIVLWTLILLVILISIPIGIIFIDGAISSYNNKHPYISNNIIDYGNITGNNNDAYAKEFIFSFFPEKIMSNFKDATYHYYAKKSGRYCYEAYLEFTIEDKTEFDKYVSALVDKEKCGIFKYDNSYNVYVVSNSYSIGTERVTVDSEDKGYVVYPNTDLGMILYSENKQKLVFVAIGAGMDSFSYTSELNYFTQKFSVDIFELMTQCYPYVDYYNVITGHTATAVYEQKNIESILEHSERIQRDNSSNL